MSNISGNATQGNDLLAGTVLQYAILAIYRSRLQNELFKNIFDFTTAGDWDCVVVGEHLPALCYSVDFIFLSLGIMGFIVELRNYWRVTDED